MSPGADRSALARFNQETLTALERAIALQQSRFTLILVRCNYRRLQQALLDQLLSTYPSALVLPLPRRLPSLLEALQITLQLRPQGAPTPAALMVTELDQVEQLEAMLKAANLARDMFPEKLPLPLVFWIDDYLLSQISQFAQDLKNLGPPTLRFEMPPAELIAGLHREANELFVRFLKGTPDPMPVNPLIDLASSDRLGNELTYALRDLAAADHELDAELDASLLFAQGRQAHSQLEMDAAKSCYSESLAYWKQLVQAEKLSPPAVAPRPGSLTPLHKKATLLLHLGFWWRSLAVLQRSTYRSSLRSARQYFEQALACLRQSQQPELVARFIASLAEVLQKQQDWSALELIAQESLALHQQTDDWVRQARDHGFLAEVALARQAWTIAQQQAEQALALLRQTEQRLQQRPDRPALAEAFQLAQRFQRGWYRFLLGEAKMELGQPAAAISLLQQARQEVDADADLILYLKILEALIQRHGELGDYRQAFEVKLERRRVEYRHNFRAFIGAGALQPQPRDSPAPTQPKSPPLAVSRMSKICCCGCSRPAIR